MKKLFILLVLFLFFVPVAVAVEEVEPTPVLDETGLTSFGPTVSFGLTICKNDSTKLEIFGVNIGEPFFPEKEGGAYSVVIEDKKGDEVFKKDLDLKFVLLSDPPVMLECGGLSASIKYNKNYHKLSVYRGDNLIFYEELPAFCNEDTICDPSENFFSCEVDCPSGSADGVCDGKLYDGICDHDCDPKSDWKDCNISIEVVKKHEEKQRFVPKKPVKLPSWVLPLVVVVLLFVGAISGFKFYKKLSKKRAKKKKKEEKAEGLFDWREIIKKIFLKKKEFRAKNPAKKEESEKEEEDNLVLKQILGHPHQSPRY